MSEARTAGRWTVEGCRVLDRFGSDAALALSPDLACEMVSALNAHDALVAALRGALALYDAPEFGDDELGDMVSILRAALAEVHDAAA